MTVGQRVQTLELTTSDLRSELSQARRRVSRLASADIGRGANFIDVFFVGCFGSSK